jgi:hypothetical protein
MSEADIAHASPTDIFQQPACSFCGTPARNCRVLLHNETFTAFICESCAPTAAAMARDALARQEASNADRND